MKRKGTVFTLGVALLCTGLMVAHASQDAAKKSAQPSSTKAAAQLQAKDRAAPVTPGTVSSPQLDAKGPAFDGRSSEELAKEQALQQEPVQSAVMNSKQEDEEAAEKAAKLAEEEGGAPPPEGPLPGFYLGEVDPDPESGQGGFRDERDACAGAVPTGTGSGAWQYAPLYGYYNNARSMSLIKRSEITYCDPGLITELAIEITTASSTPNFTNMEIRMKKTTDTSVGTIWDGSGTLVWSGSTTMTPVGWKTFDITDFLWDSENLLITWQYSGTYNATRPSYRYSTPSPTFICQNYAYNDTALPTTGFTTSTNRVLYRLVFPGTAPTGACCDPASGGCTIMTAADCAAAYGVYQGYGTLCEPNPCAQPCTLICDPNDTLETEACGASTNGGCNSSPYVFQDITCGTTICGTAWANAGLRDTDWYRVTVTAPTLLTWTVTSEFPSAVFILSGTCPSPVVRKAAYGGNCTTVSAVFGVDAGTYMLFVATGTSAGGIFYGWPCGTSNDYEATLTCTPYYCASYATSTSHETIKNVTLGTINNTTLDCDTYSYFGNISTQLQAVGTYPFSLTIGDCEGSLCYPKRAAIYVDWNQNRVFDPNTNELAWASGQEPNAPCPDMTLTGNITVPVTATVGPTIMRVIVKQGTVTTPPPACGTYTYGATEDYTIIVTPPPPLGACCDPNGGCTITYGVDCLPPNVYKGDGTVCDPNPCLGACCYLNGSCQLLTPDACAASSGNYLGDGTDCGTDNPCPQPGACCFNDGSCLDVPEGACTGAGGTFKGVGTTCATTLCPVTIVTFPFDTDPGWTMDAGSEWQFGPPQGLNCGLTGRKDPNQAYTGANVYGYDLTGLGTYLGCYEVSQAQYNLTTTPISTVGYINIELRFWRWLGVESATYDHASIQVSNDGTTWTDVWVHTGTTINDTAWAKYTYALPSAANQPTVYVRWTMGTTDSSVVYQGWNIDDVEIWGAIPPPQGACCDGEVCTIELATACLPPRVYKGDGTFCEPNPCVGACCYLDGSCALLTPDACATSGGDYLGDATNCGPPNPCPQPGDNCQNPKVIALPPVTWPVVDNDTTCGRINDYANTCLGSYDGGEDIIYALVVTQDVCVNVQMATTSTYTGMAIHNTCPLDPTTCLYKATYSGAGGVTLSNVMLYAAVGTYYLMIDTFPSPTCIPAFTLTISECPPGACCYPDFSCQVQTPTACLAAGGTWNGAASCDPNPCAPDFVVTAPGCWDGDTTGAPHRCTFDPNTEQHIYLVTIPWTDTWTFETCTSGYDTRLYVGTTRCAQDIGYDDDSCTAPNGLGSLEKIVTLPAGDYWVTVSGYSGAQGTYTLCIYPPCNVTCPEGALIEPELCGTHTDEGCNITPHVFVDINCGETYCGWADTYVVDADYRDTDWYRFTLAATNDVAWTVTSEFPSANFIMSDAGLDCVGVVVEASAYGGNCTPVTATKRLTAGTYYLFVSLGTSAGGIFTGYPCSDYSDYVATLTCTPVVGACCTPTTPYCQVLSEPDCTAAGGTYLGDDTQCDPNDCNNNGIPDKCEIALGLAQDCNLNDVPDLCDIANCPPGELWCADCQGDGIPDGCQLWDQLRTVIHDNGPLATGAGCGGQISVLQDNLGLNIYGFGAQQTAGNRVADDFTLDGPCTIDTITVYTYQTGTAPPSITSVVMQIWNGPPNAGGTVIWGDLTTNRLVSCTASNIYRTLATVDCSRHIQTCVCAVGTQLPAGTYWIDYSFAGTGTSGPWAPEVTILGLTGKPGANALQYLGTLGAWTPVLDPNSTTYPGVWPQDFPFIVEGFCGAPTNDCNLNGIPDECDIHVSFPGGFCNDTIPPCDTDYNHNGVPDHCEICGDLNGDTYVNETDFWLFQDAFGQGDPNDPDPACPAGPKYRADADFDHDGCITLVDYQGWLMCYHMANGKDFRPPAKKVNPPAPAPTRPRPVGGINQGGTD